MSINFRQEGDQIVILGQTYPFKDEIKAIGCSFNGSRKLWQIPFSQSALQAVQDLCESKGGGRLETQAVDTPDVPVAIARKMSASAPRGLSLTPGVVQITPVSLPESELPTMPDSQREDVSDPSRGMSIAELMNIAQSTISRAFPLPIWIIGEIQGLQNRGSRGIYLNLAEGIDGGSDAATLTVNATIWSNSIKLMEHRHGKAALQDVLADGLAIRCLCTVSLYKGRGNLSLNIQEIDVAYTKGALALQREKLLRELKIKGLDQLNKHLSFPAFPFCIGLICAEGSRAQTDFLHQLFSAGFCGEVAFVPAAAQGERVLTEVPAAIATLIDHGCDAIVITRGGGSAADLRWFDAAEIAYAICRCPVPIIAAIGHHDDVSVAEIVCHLRCKTPTAAADAVVEVFVKTRTRIEEMAEFFANGLTRQVQLYQERQGRISERLHATAIQSIGRRDQQLLRMTSQLTGNAQNTITALIGRFDHAAHSLSHFALRNIMGFERSLGEVDKIMAKLDPRPWLNQGWTQLFAGDRQIRSIDDAEVNMPLRARLIDGRIDLAITALTPDKEKT